MGLLGPGGVPLPPPSNNHIQPPTPTPPVDVLRGIPITIMIYPHATDENSIAVIVHWPPNTHPDLIQTALERAILAAAPALEQTRQRMQGAPDQPAL